MIGLAKVAQLLRDEAAAKNYPFFTRPFSLNIIGVRAAMVTGDEFDDSVVVVTTDPTGRVLGLVAKATLDPGLAARVQPRNPAGVARLPRGHYPSFWTFGVHHPGTDEQYECLVTTEKYALVERDNDHDTVLDPTIPSQATNIQLHMAGPRSTRVGRWSEGCVVIQYVSDFKLIMSMCAAQRREIGVDKFSFTIHEVSESPALAEIVDWR